MNAGEPARTRVEIAIAIVCDQGRYLIGLRPDDVPLGGYWEFPGGKMQAAETPESAAERECQEETGLEVRAVGTYPQAMHDYDHAAVRLHFIRCEPLAARHPLPERFRWVAAAELADYRFPPANAELLRLLAKA